MNTRSNGWLQFIRGLAATAMAVTTMAYASAPAFAARGATQAPVSVSISAPAAGATVSSPFVVSGKASAKNGIAKVTVTVDAGSAMTASGTTSWTSSVTATAGAHTVYATAYDTRGTASTTSTTVNVPQPSAPPSSTWSANGITVTARPVTNPQVSTPTLLGRGRLARLGDVSVTVYANAGTWAPWARFRNEVSGAQTDVAFPTSHPSGQDWTNASWALDGRGNLWVFGGGGPVRVWQYALSGSPLPTSMALVAETTFGDADSRANDLIALTSGAVVLSWHQQGSTGPQGLTVGYRPPSGTWSTTPLSMTTMASKWATVQHPSDGSIWILGNADASHAISAIHLHEATSQLVRDWVDPSYIDVAKYADNAPDSENPDVEAAPDTSTGAIDVVYEGNHVQYFSGVKVAYPVVASIGANGPTAFVTLNQWVERVTMLGLVVQPGAIWVAYHPLDQSTLSYSDVYVSRLANSAWQGPVRLDTAAGAWDAVGFGVATPDFVVNTASGSMTRYDVTTS